MDSLEVKEFQGQKVISFKWKGKTCWIALQIVNLLEYKNSSKTIAYCIKSQKFKMGEEYDLLKGNELKELKKLVHENTNLKLKQSPKLIIFYESGLYGFLQFSKQNQAINFKVWIRREIMPYFEKRNTEVLNEEENFKFLEKQEPKIITTNIKNLDVLLIINESYKNFKDIFDEVELDAVEKLKILETIYNVAGINLGINKIAKKEKK